jgi:predicted N-acetyltransferase YhbS
MTELATSTLIPLDQVDHARVEHLLDLAFGPDRHGRTAYAIRQGTDALPALSFAALDAHDTLVGTIQAWPVALTTPEGKRHPLIMVGPVAILPGRQGQGFGRALMAAQASAIDPAAPLPQVLIGDEPYYGKFGFVEAPRGWTCPGRGIPRGCWCAVRTLRVLPQSGHAGSLAAG